MNSKNGTNVCNLWYQIQLPGIISHNKRLQWCTDWAFVSVMGGDVSGWKIDIPTLSQYDSYSTLTKSVNYTDVLYRNQYWTKDITFNQIGCQFNNICALDNGMINVIIYDLLGNDLTSWNYVNTSYVISILIWEVPDEIHRKLLH